MIREFGSEDILFLLLATRWTILLTLASALIGGTIALVVAVLRIVPLRPANWLAIGYINLVQGTPVLGQLFIFFFGFSVFGWSVGAWTAAVTAFSIYASAYLAEIWRGGLQSVPKTQWESSAALGLTYLQRLRYIIVPQAVRINIPPTVGFIVQLIKNTSLASVIGFVELSRAGQMLNNATFAPMSIYLTVAAIYFVICYSLSNVSQRLERRIHVAR
ncbi:amino acid ABC transporter permease [Psychromarinibacter sp. C21-152]|uniref:Amino acid ABC transporter permease n=1 Tax=Psychromarinibacter sediminicola TaxID=3033385 RepID=A0AAE3TC56_9RHOB|nr:amino acid ABC transporter permease [Psychromarinibacter sediminicola]MDF0603310.1 amino acid ABC transporter permease [Psychromarinibacter sediminicola]